MLRRAALLVSLSLGMTLTAHASPLPSPGMSAPGVDVACRPSAAHPVPVLLLHGTRGDKTVSWQSLGPALVKAGFCVFSVDFTDRGEAPMAEHLRVASARVQEVLDQTRAREISLIGHSLGGLVARDVVARGGGRGVVDDVISMGTPQYGYYTAPPGDLVDAAFNTGCQSCEELAQGSPYLKRLNEPDPTPGRASYTTLISADDAVALPLSNQYLPAGRQVTNVLLQDGCPGHYADHVLLPYDSVVLQWVLGALQRNGPADPQQPVSCPAV